MENAGILMVIVMLGMACFLSGKTRKPAVSGRWYPSDKEQLRRDIENYLKEADLPEELFERDILGIMVPHAGYMFSAPVAAWCYKLLEGKDYDTVIFIGSSHHYFRGIVSVYQGDSLSTPLGIIPIDTELSEFLKAQDSRISFEEAIHIPEHSNEAQYPFMQFVQKNFRAVSILTSADDDQLMQKTADALYDYISQSNKKYLFVISSDMSHFHSYEQANMMDKVTLELIESENWEELRQKTQSRECELCGMHALDIFSRLYARIGGDKPLVLKYANSGDAHPEYGLDEVVGYGAVVFPHKMNSENKMKQETKKWLLNLARQTIEASLKKDTEQYGSIDDPVLNQQRAVFVTLHKNGNLRGCIGHMQPRTTLKEAVIEMSRAAAFEDPRFPQVSVEEVSELEIEISVLTPMQRIRNLDEIVMGRDGVMVRNGYHSGVFLPQVARETGWDRDTFLQQLCSGKAYLPSDAYLDPSTEIFIFQVEEFSE